MKILVVGGGGREHSLAWKLAGDGCRPEIMCAPGNAGTAEVGTNLDIAAEDVEGLLAWAVEHRPDLTVIGPEAPLCAGLADALTAEGLRAFGPSKAAARLEGSKLFAKEVMEAAGVPTAACKVFVDLDEALAHVRARDLPMVVKADGLAAGKGVMVCGTLEDAEQAIRDVLERRLFGEAGRQAIVEDCLVGEEASILALIDGEHIVMLASSQDHKRAYDNDMGPNTGGMGAYSPAPVVTDELWPVIREQVFERTLGELRKRGIVYQGVLYAGLMVTDAGPRVLEFNCRFGDPETQAILPRFEGDLVPVMEACLDGSLTEDMVRWKRDACVCVVMAAGGYPGAYEKGTEIEGLADAGRLEGVTVFHAGTGLRDGRTVTTGGRVLGVTALGDGLESSVKNAYRAVSKIKFEQAQYRTDIAGRALGR